MASHHHHHHHRDQHGKHGSAEALGNSDTFTDMNRKHWDQVASTYTSLPWQKEFINRTHAFILSNLHWIGVDFLDSAAEFETVDAEAADAGAGAASQRRVRVLDYACGPGTITSVLHGYASEFVGVDVSANMVGAYNGRFADPDQQSDGGFESKAKAYVGNLLDGTGPSDSVVGPEFFGFDLAVVGYGFHHFEDLDLATARLVERLKPGGVLMIVDFVTHEKLEEGEDGEAKQAIIAHQGFGEEEVSRVFGRAGLVDVGFVVMEGEVEMRRPGKGKGEAEVVQKRKVFLGRGRKAERRSERQL